MNTCQSLVHWYWFLFQTARKPTYYLNLIWTNSHIVHCFLLWTNRHIMVLSTSVTDYRILQVHGYGFSLRVDA